MRYTNEIIDGLRYHVYECGIAIGQETEYCDCGYSDCQVCGDNETEWDK